jgi:hypothetical protein
MDVVVNDVAKASVDVADDDGASMDLVREVTVSRRNVVLGGGAAPAAADRRGRG